MVVVKVPSELWIDGVAYTVRFQQGLMSNDDAQGQSCDNAATILLDPALSDSKRREVFLHECLHRIAYALGWPERRKLNPMIEEHALALGRSLAALCRELGIEFDFSDLEVRDA